MRIDVMNKFNIPKIQQGFKRLLGLIVESWIKYKDSAGHREIVLIVDNVRGR